MLQMWQNTELVGENVTSFETEQSSALCHYKLAIRPLCFPSINLHIVALHRTLYFVTELPKPSTTTSIVTFFEEPGLDIINGKLCLNCKKNCTRVNIQLCFIFTKSFRASDPQNHAAAAKKWKKYLVIQDNWYSAIFFRIRSIQIQYVNIPTHNLHGQ